MACNSCRSAPEHICEQVAPQCLLVCGQLSTICSPMRLGGMVGEERWSFWR